MRGWEPGGPPFRRLLNQNEDIPPQASRVHGYTREILERDGDVVIHVYRDFATYAGGWPIAQGLLGTCRPISPFTTQRSTS